MSQFFPVHYFEVLILLNRSAANFYSISKKKSRRKILKMRKVREKFRKFSRLFWKSRFFENFWKNRNFSKTWFFENYWNSFENRKIKFSKIFDIFKNFRNFQKISKIFATQLWRILIFDLVNENFWFFYGSKWIFEADSN